MNEKDAKDILNYCTPNNSDIISEMNEKSFLVGKAKGYLEARDKARNLGHAVWSYCIANATQLEKEEVKSLNSLQEEYHIWEADK